MNLSNQFIKITLINMLSFATGIARSSRMRGWSCVGDGLAIRFPPHARQRTFNTNTAASLEKVARLTVPHISYSQKPNHVQQVAERLHQDGILKISLEFPDKDSAYLESLIRNLHTNHNHCLPISHSATRGWFWDVRPSSTNFQTANHQARSETMEDFPWHTDCSYEYPPPRFFALQVLQPDRFGGGTLSVMNVARLSEHLRAETVATLMRPLFRINIPTEFIKDPARTWIHGSIVMPDERGMPSLIRFRDDIVTPLGDEAAAALADLRVALQHLAAQDHSTLHLSAKDLPAGSIILIDNRRWLHARNHVNDPARHLRRVRWDASPFPEARDSSVSLSEAPLRESGLA